MMKSAGTVAALASALLLSAPMAIADDVDVSEDLVTGFFDALTLKDFDRIETMFAADATVVLPFAAGQETIAAPAVFGGIEQLMGYYRGAGQRIAEVGFTETEITVSSDAEIVFVENVGDMVLPDGRRYENRYVWRFVIEDGLIPEVREYYDPKVADVAFGRN